MTTMAWTDDRVRHLKTLFEEGKSATEISNVFGVSRNAVCGKLSRLGLFRNGGIKPKPKGPAAIIKPKLRITQANTNSNGMRVSVVHGPAVFATLRTVDVEPRKIEFADLKPSDCRYPEGDPATFCGHPRLENSSYCMAHHALCTAPLPPRRR